MNANHEKKRSAAIAYLSARRIGVLVREEYTTAANTDIRPTINRAKSRANLKQMRIVRGKSE